MTNCNANKHQGAGATRTGASHSARRAHLLIVGALTAVLATGCSAGSPSPGELGDNKQILAQCDPAAPPASWVQIDGTGSSNSEVITAERMAAVESIMRRTAICGGYLRVTVFTSSSAATSQLFEGLLELEGATDNARLRRVPAVVDEVMTKIRAAYGPAVATLAGGGSDVIAQLRLASEWIGQLGDNLRLHIYLLSDGFQNIGVDLGARALSREDAAALAEQATVPNLAGASVVVAGIGRIAGNPPPSNLVEGLVAYYDALCRKTGAATCSAVTDYATEGR